jgi:hypothetical protein
MCLAACTQFTPAALSCRAFHCTLAEEDPVTHCPHALGQAVCL